METQFYLLLPYFAAFVVSSGVTFYLFQHRKVKGALTFGFFSLNQTIWSLAFLIETISTNIEAKVFWDNLQFINMMVGTAVFPIFAKELAGLPIKNMKTEWLKYQAFPLFSLLIVYADPWLKLVRPSIELVESYGLVSLYYPFTTFMMVMSGYVYLLLFITIFILARRFLHTWGYFRNQIVIIIIGILIPIFGSIIILAGLTPPFLRDITPLAFGIGNLVIMLGFKQYGLFNVIPIARESLVENLPTAIIVLDNNNRVVDLNPAALKFLGHAENDCVGRSAEDVFDKHPNFIERYANTIEISDIYETDEQGSSRFFDLTINPIFESGKRLIGRAIILNDVTSRYLAERELKSRTRQLENANQELESFAYSVSHDLRAPLRAISGFSRILMSDHQEELSGEAQQLFERINTASQQMNGLIESILKISRLSRAPLNREEINLSELAQSICEDLRSQNPHRLVEFDIQKEITAYADIQLMRTVLENLLGNAWKYSAKVEHTVISFGMNKNETEIVYFINDNGIGFDMKYADKLFGAFQRLHSDEDFQGHGIGLASAQRIIHRHGGYIFAKSEPGKGATFYFTLGA